MPKFNEGDIVKRWQQGEYIIGFVRKTLVDNNDKKYYINFNDYSFAKGFSSSNLKK